MVLAGLPKHLDAVITFAERGLGMQERFSLKANIDLLVRTSLPRFSQDVGKLMPQGRNR